RSEQDAHADHAGCHELQIAAAAGLTEHGAEPESEHEQVQERLAERCDHLRARPQVALYLTKPERKDDSHRRAPPHIRAMRRICSAASAVSSRIVLPVSSRNAPSRESAPVCARSSALDPTAMILPWSMIATRCATRSASSM